MLEIPYTRGVVWWGILPIEGVLFALRVSLAETFGSLAKALTSQAADDATFGNALVGVFRSLADFDKVIAFAYRGEARPMALFGTLTPAEHHLHVTLYEPGPFLIDPFYRNAIQRRLGFWRMRDLAPDRFYQSEYYRSYYVEMGLAEEVGFFVGTDAATVVVISLMRAKASGPFTRGDLATLRQAEPLVAALVSARWRDVGARFEERPGPRAWLSSPPRPKDVAAWRGLDLTEREAAIVDLVLQGHSSDSIAARLGIALGTVKVHRRNIYRKLRISSQTELLAIYIYRIVAQTG